MATQYNLPLTIGDTGYGSTAAQGSYVAAGSAQPANRALYNTQAPYSFQNSGVTTQSNLSTPYLPPAQYGPYQPSNSPSQTQNKPTGGGGGNGGGGGGGGGTPNTYYDPSTGRTFNSQGDFMNEVNNAFGDASNILDTQEQRVRSGEQDLYKQATSPYDSTLPLLQQARDENLTRNTQQTNEEKIRETNAFDAARNLFNELRQGNQQRFGGSSSAGEFAYNLLGRELQRGLGQIQQTAGQNFNKLKDQANQIITGFQSQLQQLNTQKEAALAGARDVFRQKLSEIDNARFGLAQNKSQAKLQALYQLRSEAQNIQNSFIQLQQQMAANAQQAYLQTVSNVQTWKGQTGGQVQVDPFAAATYSRFGGGQGSQNLGGFQGSTGGRRYDYNTGQWV